MMKLRCFLFVIALRQYSSNASKFCFRNAYGLSRRTTQDFVKKWCSAVDTNAQSNEPSFLGEYAFKVSHIPVEECFSTQAMEKFHQSLPVVLKNCDLAKPTEQWSLEYLKKNIISENMTAFVSNTRRFLYYNEKAAMHAGYKWKKPHEIKLMKFAEFLQTCEEFTKANNGSRAYFQSQLDQDDLSSDMQDDMFLFNYPWLRNLTQQLGWGGQDLNLLFVGMKDVVTPAHYDIVEGLFLQISGWKKVILFHPDQYKNLYPYPVHHPHDRQTQVNFEEPDLEKFPNFRHVEGMEAVLGPGDVLYIPNYWWHYFESERNNYTMSINFWFEPNPPFQSLDMIINNEHEDENNSNTTESEQNKQRKGDVKDETPSDERGNKRDEKTRTDQTRHQVGDDEDATSSDKSTETDQTEHEEENGDEEDSENLVAGFFLGNDLISSSRRMFVRRRIEEFIALSLQNASEVGPMLKEMVTSRFDNLEL